MAEALSRSPAFLSGGGELGALIRGHDWARTPLGPPDRWPQALQIAARIMLTSRQPIWIGWGDELTYLYNDPYRSIIGGKHPWALGRPTREVWREIWGDIGPMLTTAMQGIEGTYVEAQLLIMERHGYPEETYYTFSYSPISDADGRTGGIICANTDDTRRVIGERQLATLRELAARAANARTWQQACSASAEALATNPHDLPFALIYVAEPDSGDLALAGAQGIPPGHPAAPAIVPAESRGPWPLADVLRRHEFRLVETLGADLPTGAWRQPPTHAAVLPILPTGKTGRAGVLVAGLNPFRQLDESYRGFLDLAVGQIATAVANAQAYEDERRRAEALSEIDRAKTTFFSNASHEFRTPLTLMLSPLEDLLVRTATRDTTVVERRDLELMHRNGLRLLKLVNTLLDFSRIEAGRVQATYEPVDLAALTADLASTFRSAMARAGLAFRIDCTPLPEAVHVDRDMWEKIVLNLISNAFKYTLEGEVALTLRPGNDGTAVLSVRDTGIGIPEHELPRLFERFHRIEGQRGRTHEGTGIGLALVQELVRLHGGAVHAASQAGEGSTFTVTMPFGTAHLPADRIGTPRTLQSAGFRAEAYAEEALRWLTDAPPVSTDVSIDVSGDLIEPELSPIATGERRRVLLADDNADMRDYVRRLLAPRYDVEAVGDGEAALDAVRRHRPDLVLSDVMMPRLDGFGLLRALRADTALRDIPVVLLSARAGEEAKVEGLETGADDYLVKPFSARELFARVATNLDLAHMRQHASDVLREETLRLEVLNRTGAALSAELDLDKLVQRVTDAAVELTRAKFGAFFYNVINEKGESYTLYTLSGAPRAAFEKFPMPRNTAVFEPTFRGDGVVRSDDITQDPRYGRSGPHYGQPKGHLPVRSYLAVPVVSRSGEVLGGLFFGHPEPAIFTERDELIVTGVAAQAAIAMDNARLYRASRQAEEALLAVNQTLEQRVREEVEARMKAEEAFRQVQKMEAIAQLTGGVAHDFNNLLHVIAANTELLTEAIETGDLAGRRPELLSLTGGLARSTNRAATLTQQLLAFARRQPLEPKPIEVNKLVGGMSEMLRRVLGEAISIETIHAGGLWRTVADANQLENALLNLAVNARDAMPGGGKLTIETANAHLDDDYVRAHTELTAGQYVMIAVSDSGSGMPPNVLEKAFEPFFTTKEIGRGTGLGLSQVYGFVKQSGGHVKLYSEPGEGTTVKLYLPRLTGEQAGTDALPARGAAPRGNGELVLLVEDYEDVRARTADMLERLGYRVVAASDGPSALALLDAHPDVALLFTDVGLPGGLNGRQVADEARRRRPALKILFTTGYARNAIVHHGRLDPGLDLIVKPFGFAALGAKLRAVLSA